MATCIGPKYTKIMWIKINIDEMLTIMQQCKYACYVHQCEATLPERAIVDGHMALTSIISKKWEINSIMYKQLQF